MFTFQSLEVSKPFSYSLFPVEGNKSWDFFYVTTNSEIRLHRIRCYKFGKVTIYKNGALFVSRTIEGLMTHLIGRPIASCFQKGTYF